MDKEGFKAWLLNNGESNERLIKDTISRAKRVEAAFKQIDQDFSYEREYARDQGVSFVKLVSRRGVSITEPIALPIGTNQMDSITNAAKKYIKFLSSKQS